MMALFPGDMNIGWGFGLHDDLTPSEEQHYVISGELPASKDHCTGSPTCQCSDCRLTEWNSGQPPEDQLPHGYKYEPPEVKANREVGLYATGEPREKQETEEVYNGFQYVDAPIEEEESLPTDPMLAVSELEQRVNDLVERLGNLTLVVNVLIEQVHRVVHDEGRIDGHKAILTSLVAKVAIIEDHVEFLRTGIEKE